MSSKKEISREIKRIYEKELHHQKRIEELLIKRRQLSTNFIKCISDKKITYIEDTFKDNKEGSEEHKKKGGCGNGNKKKKKKQMKLENSIKMRYSSTVIDVDTNVFANLVNMDVILLICNHLSYLDMIHFFLTSKKLNLIVSICNPKPYFDYILNRIMNDKKVIVNHFQPCLNEFRAFDSFHLKENNIVHLLLVCHVLVSFDDKFRVYSYQWILKGKAKDFKDLRLHNLFIFNNNKKTIEPLKNETTTFIGSNRFSRMTTLKRHLRTVIHQRLVDNHIKHLNLDSCNGDLNQIQQLYLTYADKEDIKLLEGKLASKDSYLNEIMVLHSKGIYNLRSFMNLKDLPYSPSDIYVKTYPNHKGVIQKQGWFDDFFIGLNVRYYRKICTYTNTNHSDLDAMYQTIWRFVKYEISLNLRHLFSF